MPLIDRIAKVNNLPSIPVPIQGSYFDLPKPKPFLEYGTTGLLRTRGVGYIFDEWSRDLQTSRQKQIYREMRDQDAVIGAMFFALEMLLRTVKWTVQPGSGKLGQQYAEFFEQCKDDMSHPFEDFVAEAVNMFAFGFSLFEVVCKRRLGPDGRKASKFDDGLIGWRKFAPRAQETILYWMWDDEGGLQGAVQLAAPDWRTIVIPIQQLLLFRTTSNKQNPEGRSLLRNCYRSYVFKRRIEEIEVIGIERDLCGLPVVYTTQEGLEAMGGQAEAQKMVTNIRRDDQMGIILPQAFDEDKNPHVKLELLKTAGPRQADPSATIARYNHDILNTMLAGWIEFGQQPSGNRALHTSAKGIFYSAITAFLESVAAVLNRIAIPRLMALNRMDPEYAPKFVPGEVGDRDLDELASYVLKLSQSGLTFFDHDTANLLRKRGGLPDEPEGEEAGPAAKPARNANPAAEDQEAGKELERAA